MSAADFAIVPIEQAPLEGVLEVLDRSLGPGHSRDWYAWKHQENPFGRSPGWAAVDGGGRVLGVRLFLRWELIAGDGIGILAAVRPVDTATAPEARGRGVFRSLTEHAVAAVTAGGEADLIFNTPNTNSRPGYERMGWTILPPIAHGIRPILWGKTAALDAGADLATAHNLASRFAARKHPERVCEPVSSTTSDQSKDASLPLAKSAFDPDIAPGRLQTRRSQAYLRWRYDSRSGLAYRTARLRAADAPNGIVYRIAARRWARLLLVHELAGIPAEREILLRSVARLEGARFALAAAGPGSLPTAGGPLLHRGGSVIAVRPLAACDPEPTRLDSWALTLGDLERVI